MKKLFLALSAISMVTAVSAQSEKYVVAMQSNVIAIDTTRNPEALQELANKFERIAETEKTLWLPYYYAALAQVNMGYSYTGGQTSGGLTAKIDPIADKAEALINKAEALSKNNSEIFVIKKMIATLRMMADPMNRYMQYGPQAQQALETAKKLNANNPRVYLLEGQDKFYTPEQFGGSKTEAKRLFEEALKKYNAHSPASAIDPVWGKRSTEYFLAQANK